MVEAGDVRVLVDHGISTRRLSMRLDQLGVKPESIDAVIVTHEHTDHVAGLRVWRKRFGTPLFVNRPTSRAVGGIRRADGPVCFFTTGNRFDVGELSVYPFPVSHDALDPVGLVFEWKGRRIGMATDLGRATELVRRRLEGADVVVIESNHDPEMLLNGPYPWPVKERIRRNHGHMSNAQAAALLRRLAHPGLKAVLLAHLSRRNNLPELALNSAREALGRGTSAEVLLGWQDRIAGPVKLD